ncbi:MAG: hypothetical protein U9N42_05685 [Campylobacterota bacterium]|nr:hypothetical protein [Campylobacterota bacterium]
MKKPFNPAEFDTTITIKELAQNHSYLSSIDFTKVSLAKEIVPLNYEIISTEYEDLKYSKIEDYFEMEIDRIV